MSQGEAGARAAKDNTTAPAVPKRMYTGPKSATCYWRLADALQDGYDFLDDEFKEKIRPSIKGELDAFLDKLRNLGEAILDEEWPK